MLYLHGAATVSAIVHAWEHLCMPHAWTTEQFGHLSGQNLSSDSAGKLSKAEQITRQEDSSVGRSAPPSSHCIQAGSFALSSSRSSKSSSSSDCAPVSDCIADDCCWGCCDCSPVGCAAAAFLKVWLTEGCLQRSLPCCRCEVEQGFEYPEDRVGSATSRPSLATCATAAVRNEANKHSARQLRLPFCLLGQTLWRSLRLF